jgi:hypothetical protein
MFNEENCKNCLEDIKASISLPQFNYINEETKGILTLIEEYNQYIISVMSEYSFPSDKLINELDYIKSLNNDYLDTKDKDYAFESYKEAVVSLCEIITYGELEFEKGNYNAADVERLQDEIAGFDEVTMDIIEENDELYEKLDEMEEKEHYVEADKIREKIEKNENNIIEVSYKIDIKDYVLNKLLDMSIEE